MPRAQFQKTKQARRNVQQGHLCWAESRLLGILDALTALGNLPTYSSCPSARSLESFFRASAPARRSATEHRPQREDREPGHPDQLLADEIREPADAQEQCSDRDEVRDHDPLDCRSSGAPK
jgi:hypothetical protein